MGSQKKEAILQAKWAVNFVQKAKWAKNELLNSQPTIDGLKSEIHTYMAANEDVPRLPTDTNPVAWWKSHAMEFPKWANAFRLVLLVQPSSAAAERVFSILQHFTAQQESSLEDYLELSVTLQYNLAH